VISFVAGVFIDIDHILDYYVNHRPTLDLKEIYNTCLSLNLNKVRLWLHSYELIILLWCGIFLVNLSDPWKALAIGMTQHLICDQLVNPVHIFGYSLLYRMSKGFDKNALLKDRQ
jgi:hypothetical protein